MSGGKPFGEAFAHDVSVASWGGGCDLNVWEIDGGVWKNDWIYADTSVLQQQHLITYRKSVGAFSARCVFQGFE